MEADNMSYKNQKDAKKISDVVQQDILKLIDEIEKARNKNKKLENQKAGLKKSIKEKEAFLKKLRQQYEGENFNVYIRNVESQKQMVNQECNKLESLIDAEREEINKVRRKISILEQVSAEINEETEQTKKLIQDLASKQNENQAAIEKNLGKMTIIQAEDEQNQKQFVEELNKLQVRLVSQTMAFKGKMKKENEDDSKAKQKHKYYEVLDCSLALRSLTKSQDDRIFQLTRDLDSKVREHNKIRNEIERFKNNLGSGENKGDSDNTELTPDDIANKLKEKEESIQDVEMKASEEEQKLTELRNEYDAYTRAQLALQSPAKEGSGAESMAVTQLKKETKVDQSGRKDNMQNEFEQVKKEVGEIMTKFKGMTLSKVLKVQSEMEGIEFNWNNYQQTLKILETFVDALLTAKTRKTKPDENLIIKIVKEDKPFDNTGMESIKEFNNKEFFNKIKGENEKASGDNQKKNIKEIIESAKNHFIIFKEDNQIHDNDKQDEN